MNLQNLHRVILLKRTRFSSARGIACTAAWLAAAFGGLLAATEASAQELPSRLADSTFWKLITDFSEPGGYFRSDNFVSNELAFQYVIPTLQKTTKPAGVYLGVGPDQNFTYIIALKPKLSFIFDIRRGNLEEHLLYKAVIEMSENRADFLSLLFSKPRPAGLDTTTSADVMLDAYESVRTSDTLYQKNLKAVRDWLTKHHGFALRARPLGLHRTMAFEPRAIVHDQDVRSQIPQHLGGESKFDALAGDDVAADLARHDDRRRLDWAAHHGALPNHNAVLGNDLTVNLAVDPCWPLEVKLAPDLGALAQIGAGFDRSVNFARSRSLIEERHFHSFFPWVLRMSGRPTAAYSARVWQAVEGGTSGLLQSPSRSCPTERGPQESACSAWDKLP